MKIKYLYPEPITLIELAGRFDAHAAPEIEKWMDNNIPSYPGYLLFNLKDVHFVDSTALATLVRGMKQCRENGTALSLCNLQKPVRIIFELTRMDQAFNIFLTQQEALKHMKTTFIERLL